MSTPIKPGTARRLGLRRPGEWSDTMERCTRPGWGSTDVPAAWTERFGDMWSAADVLFVPGSDRIPTFDELPGRDLTPRRRQRRNR